MKKQEVLLISLEKAQKDFMVLFEATLWALCETTERHVHEVLDSATDNAQQSPLFNLDHVREG
jgi:hypothetical protein